MCSVVFAFFSKRQQLIVDWCVFCCVCSHLFIWFEFDSCARFVCLHVCVCFLLYVSYVIVLLGVYVCCVSECICVCLFVLYELCAVAFPLCVMLLHSVLCVMVYAFDVCVCVCHVS